jgi:hypothetical protein
LTKATKMIYQYVYSLVRQEMSQMLSAKHENGASDEYISAPIMELRRVEVRFS